MRYTQLGRNNRTWYLCEIKKLSCPGCCLQKLSAAHRHSRATCALGRAARHPLGLANLAWQCRRLCRRCPLLQAGWSGGCCHGRATASAESPAGGQLRATAIWRGQTPPARQTLGPHWSRSRRCWRWGGKSKSSCQFCPAELCASNCRSGSRAWDWFCCGWPIHRQRPETALGVQPKHVAVVARQQEPAYVGLHPGVALTARRRNRAHAVVGWPDLAPPNLQAAVRVVALRYNEPAVLAFAQDPMAKGRQKLGQRRCGSALGQHNGPLFFWYQVISLTVLCTSYVFDHSMSVVSPNVYWMQLVV